MSWGGRNRRRCPRVQFPCLIKVCCDKKDKDVYLTHTVNLSVGGVKIILKDPIDFNAVIDIEIDLMDTDDGFKCRGKIVWLEKRKTDIEVKPNFYDIGIEFQDVDESSKNRLERIINHHLKLGHQE